MAHTLSDTLAHSLTGLRAATFSGPLTEDAPWPDVYPSWDSANGKIEGEIASTAGMLLQIDAAVSGTPSWWVLNLVLGAGTLKPGSVLGLVADIESAEAREIAAFVRSGREDEVLDTELSEPLALRAGRRVISLLHDVDAGQPMAGAEAWHTLVLRLPRPRTSLVLHDLRLMVIPPEAGMRAGRRSLKGYAT
ncbi:hypothetical protein AL036_15735 [Salipiger aestuarii]|uniref:Uncharacterized protein n=1 Tax=Salipiger aestuarii TaxID=568098 RepID=A0A327XKN7_9RHOB|nr:hypothetical protein [Salipiger aestuarii]EIE51114.1 hypothetical protein C357_10447 [Citreicella sp. 357]KAA8606126.1 hypothetical protein AL036_15735 [Salipiger aestuarii]KAB2532698.1 hypothetical protein AL035_21000 [Salipiger aestuarii]RAK07815.1 hypothetical protein ATI53_10916 [Salipiger aestuarii]